MTSIETEPQRGAFITIEGGEGTGKSTQVSSLVSRIRSTGLDAIATREPGGSPRAETIREALLSGRIKPFGPVAEAMMFAAARLDHVVATIRPALARGAFVICDRFIDSTRVYQGASEEVRPELIAALERVVVGETVPDLTLVLDLDVETGLARAGARRGSDVQPDRFEGESIRYHQSLRRAFLDNADREPERCLVVDASRSAETLSETLWLIVRARFPALRRAGAGSRPS